MQTWGENANSTEKGYRPSRCAAVSLSAASFQIAWVSKASSPRGLVLYQLPWEESEPASKPFLAHTENVDWHQRRGFVHGFCQIHLKPFVFFKSLQPRAHTGSLDLIHIKTVNKKMSQLPQLGRFSIQSTSWKTCQTVFFYTYGPNQTFSKVIGRPCWHEDWASSNVHLAELSMFIFSTHIRNRISWAWFPLIQQTE